MEEKERYTIESFEVDEPSCIFDNKTQQRMLTLVEYNYDEIVNLKNLLNQYYKRINELEKEIKYYANRNVELLDDCLNLTRANNQYFYENQQLKQQLHDLPKKIVEEIRKWGQKHYNWVGDGTGYDGQDYNECIGFNMAIDQLNKSLDAILKKYGGKNESK